MPCAGVKKPLRQCHDGTAQAFAVAGFAGNQPGEEIVDLRMAGEVAEGKSLERIKLAYPV